MASTYSPNLRLELIATGEQQGTWGSTTNNNLGTLLEEAIGGYATITVSNSGDTTLTTANGATDQSRNMVLNLTGALTATRNVICPAVEKLYFVKNSTTGGYPVTFKVSGQTGISIPNGIMLILYVDGVDARNATGGMAVQSASSVAITGGSITGITDLAIADGGTGASDAATARTNLGLAIGTNVQAQDATLQSLSALGTAANRYPYTTGVDTWAEGILTDFSRALLEAFNAATARSTLGLGTASTLNAGTSASNVVQLDGSAKLPAVDGSQLTNLPVPTSSGRLLRAPQILTSGTSFTTLSTCNSIYVEAVGGGGAGGGSSSGSTSGGFGGGSGAYCAKYFSVSPSTAYTYAIGAGGTGVSGTAGNAGGNTTFTVGATTITAGGGGGGTSSLPGGVGGTATNGDLNVPGNVGGFNDIDYGGPGGASFFGGAARAPASSANGTAGSFGGGGSGSSDNNGSGAYAGGNGGSGVIRIWEYS